MNLPALILGVVCLLLWGFWLCRRLCLPDGFAPVCGLAFGMVVLQLAGSVSLLWPAARLLFAGAVLTAVRCGRGVWAKRLTNPGVLAFGAAVAVLLAVFAVQKPQFQTWDEFSHWGVYFKSVYYQHRLAVLDTGRALAHQAYPQGMAALYALFALGSGTYSETDLLFLTALPLAAAAGALFALPTPQSGRQHTALAVCGCLAAPTLFWLFTPDTPYITAYMDAPLGALFAAALAVCLPPCKADARLPRGLAVGLLCAALSTVKEIGAVFALCVLGVWLLQCLLDGARGAAPPFAAAALPALGVPAAWKLALRLLGRSGDQFSSMGLSYFLQTWRQARSGQDPYFYEVWDRYYARLRTYPLLLGASTVKTGCLCAAAAVGLAVGLAAALGRRDGVRAALPGLCMIVYWPLYQGVLFYVYICGMSAAEALQMASWDRYFCCFFIGWLGVLAGETLTLGAALARRLRSTAGRLCGAAPAGFLAALSLAGVWQAGGPTGLYCLPAANWRAEQKQTAADLLARMDGAPDGKIWVLSADADTAVQNRWYYQYEFYPAVTDVEAQACQDDAELGDTVEQHGVRYLALFDVSDSFAARYAALADDGLAAARTGAAVYEVTQEGGKTRLTAR